MRTILDAGGAQTAGRGLGNLLSAFALGDRFKQQGQDDALLRASQIGQAQARVRNLDANTALDQNKLALEQQQLQLRNDPLQSSLLENGVPLDLRQKVEQFLQSGNFGPGSTPPAVDGVGPVIPAPVDPEKLSNIAKSIAFFNRAIATDSKIDQTERARLFSQERGARDAVISNPALALPTAQAFFATSGKAPFDNVGNTGFSSNNLTGNQFEANPVLAKLFQGVENSRRTENLAQAGSSNASASLSNARRSRVEQGLDRPVTIVDDNGQATITALPTSGDPRSIGVAQPKASGEAATNAKTRNAVIAAIERELPGLSDELFAAEVQKRLTRRGLNAPNSTASQSGAKTSGRFSSPNEVRDALKAGKLSRPEAISILQKDFGMK